MLQLQNNNPGETEIIRRAAEKGIRLFPFSATCTSGESVPTMILLGFGGMSASEIDQGIRLLSEVCF